MTEPHSQQAVLPRPRRQSCQLSRWPGSPMSTLCRRVKSPSEAPAKQILHHLKNADISFRVWDYLRCHKNRQMTFKGASPLFSRPLADCSCEFASSLGIKPGFKKINARRENSIRRIKRIFASRTKHAGDTNQHTASGYKGT